MTFFEDLNNKLAKVEQQLAKNRTTVQQDGWQTQKHAKKSRNWDYYAEEKRKLRDQLDAVVKGTPVQILVHDSSFEEKDHTRWLTGNYMGYKSVSDREFRLWITYHHPNIGECTCEEAAPECVKLGIRTQITLK
jgi:type II secretory pathway component PulJ